MAFRAASYARKACCFRICSPRNRRLVPASIPLHSFSSASIHTSFPIDSLVADAIQTDNDLEGNTTKHSRKPTERVKKIDVGQTELPPWEQWSELFPWSMEVKGRASLMNSETARRLAEAYVPEGSQDQIIIEAYPGPGILTRALLELPKERVKKVIVMEDHRRFLQFLKPLEGLDSRLTVIPLSGYLWATYDHLSDLGLLDDIQSVPWSQGHPQLQFITGVPDTVHGEQLISQFLRSIPDRQWLFKYGRIPLHLLMTDHLWQRLSAPLGSSARCKLSVIAEATSSFDYTIPPEELSPHPRHFYPPYGRGRGSIVYKSITMKPLEDQIIEKGLLDDWDYVLRRLFVQKATPLNRSLPQLAPGAATLLKKVAGDSLPLEERIDPKTPVRRLTAKEWKILAHAFADWPFKPENLSIDDFHTDASRQVVKVH